MHAPCPPFAMPDSIHGVCHDVVFVQDPNVLLDLVLLTGGSMALHPGPLHFWKCSPKHPTRSKAPTPLKMEKRHPVPSRNKKSQQVPGALTTNAELRSCLINGPGVGPVEYDTSSTGAGSICLCDG